MDEDKIRSRYERSLRYLPRAVEEATAALVFDSTEEAQTRLCFKKHRYTVAIQLPEYLKQRLSNPLLFRKSERDDIVKQFGITQLPDEESGEYTGTIIWAGAHYAVQETKIGPIRHDLLLLDTTLTPGNTCKIRYR